MIDYLRGKGVEVEWSTAAESLEMDHDDLPVVYVSRGQVGKDIISARYMIACDGARSWTRDQLHIPMDSLSAPSEESIWGVMDFVPISDFRTSPIPASGEMLTCDSRYTPILRHPCLLEKRHYAASTREPSDPIIHTAEA